jgi:uncharacterized protein YjiS (DUF1127 family)
MTALAAVPSGRALAEQRGMSLIDTLRRAWRNHATYQRTRAELTALEIREREDIGLAGHDPAAIAREAVYGKR